MRLTEPIIDDQRDELPADQAELDAQAAAQAEAKERQRHELQDMIASRLRSAIDARRTSGIEDIWLEDQNQYDGVDHETEPANAAPRQWSGKSSQPDGSVNQRSRVYFNITKPKTDSVSARVKELLLPTDDKPWEISPTPVPELQDAADGNDDRMLQLGDGTQAPAEDVAKAMIVQAEERAGRASDHIEDWLVEGRVYAEMRRVIDDAARIGTGVLKGPVPVMREDRKWSTEGGDAPVVTIAERLAPTSKRISAWDLFPDPGCGESIHEGGFVIERDYLTARSLRKLAKLPDYDREAIAQALTEGPHHGRSSRYDDRYQRERTGQTPTSDTETFEVFYYYGDIEPQRLIAGGWTIVGLVDAGEDAAAMAEQIASALQLVSVPVVVTMVNERIVRVSMNPLEAGEFPFDVFAWEPVDGQVWGRGVPRKMNPAQRTLNAAARAMLENAGLSAGPQIVIDRERIVPANGRYEITGRKLWYWTPGEEVRDVRFAFQSVQIGSAQQELQNIIKFAVEMADHLTNLPMLMQGDSGSAPDTVGGMAMLEANATSPLRAIAQRHDDNIVVPHLSRYYAWLLQDPSAPADAKGDLQIEARGATALVTRDLYAQVLPQLMPFVKDPAFALDPRKYIEELLRANKLSPARLQLTPEQAQAQAEAASQVPPDPRVQAAQINAEAKAADREATVALKTQQLQADMAENVEERALRKYVSEIEFQIQAMEFAGQKEISMEQLRGMLAAKAIDARTKKELAAAEYQHAASIGEGRGI
jgi:hypothetical protein